MNYASRACSSRELLDGELGTVGVKVRLGQSQLKFKALISEEGCPYDSARKWTIL